MKMQSSARRLLGTTSTLALVTAAFLAASGTPASAQATKGLYFGGSTLASLVFRQIFDCYTGVTVGTGAWTDGIQFSSSFNSATPTPNLLPTTCTVVSTVQGMYAGVGGGNGVRGYIGNSPQQWYGGTIRHPASISVTATTQQPPFPSVQPPFVDTLNTTFGTYPYPRVDVGLSEAPLPATLSAMKTASIPLSPTTNWTSLPFTLTASGSTTVSYTTSSYGQPIQVPAFAVNLAIPVNVNNTSSVFRIQSQISSGGSIVNGGAIQLTEGQMCAIFSGLVTDWNDTTTYIPYLDNSGTQHTDKFYYANVGNGQGTAVPYATSSKTITVVYRSDEDGTSYILTNYLKAVCPLLDPTGTYKYGAIFAQGTKALPSNNLNDLITNITNARGTVPGTPGWNVAATWVGAAGDGGVAATIGTGSAQAGYIGYVGANFTKPYAQAVSGAGLTNVDAPYSAALQNEQLRSAGISIPTMTTTTSPTFIAPTPASAGLAWGDTRLQTPTTTWTWNDYNIYNNTFTTPIAQGGVTLSGQSVLPLTNVTGAYPLSGATFLDLYSCYSVAADSDRVTNLKAFLLWYLISGTLVTSVIQNNGFNPIPSTYSSVTRSKYLAVTNVNRIAAAGAGPTNMGGCTGVAGGAL